MNDFNEPADLPSDLTSDITRESQFNSFNSIPRITFNDGHYGQVTPNQP